MKECKKKKYCLSAHALTSSAACSQLLLRSFFLSHAHTRTHTHKNAKPTNGRLPGPLCAAHAGRSERDIRRRAASGGGKRRGDEQQQQAAPSPDQFAPGRGAFSSSVLGVSASVDPPASRWQAEQEANRQGALRVR